jgi:hypothetical protein
MSERDERFPPARILSELPPRTLVRSLGDTREYRVETLVMLDDDECRCLATAVGSVRNAEALGIRQRKQRAFMDSFFGKCVSVAVVVQAVADLALVVHSLWPS